MGWSCTAKAGWVLDTWTDACVKSTDSSNVWETNKGRYMFETGREQHDGAIVGQVYRFVDRSRAIRSGSFRIEPDGTITRAPKFLKDASPSPEEIEKRYQETYGTGLIGLGSNGIAWKDTEKIAEQLAK